MKVRCTDNTGAVLQLYEKTPFKGSEFGRFGASEYTKYDLETGKEYLVMGMILSEGSLYYLLDDSRLISTYPYPLFEVVDSTIPSNWFYKANKNTDKKHPYQEAIWGYYELVFDDSHYEKLVDFDVDAHRIYFNRKIELEKQVKKIAGEND